uniref:CCHC-type domain-containing protein n=1 Tax=Pygocentrus nattereri TaxID=42514 RepID=A0AAR2KLN8_PYGNA
QADVGSNEFSQEGQWTCNALIFVAVHSENDNLNSLDLENIFMKGDVLSPHGQDSDQAASPEPRGHPSHSSAFIAVPERYDGSPGMCNSFLMQCTLYITHNPSQFRLETDKVHFVISLLTGRAKEWATALWTVNSAILQSESRFLSQFKAVFDHSSTGKEVGSQICDLKQGTRSAADYALDFRMLAAGSGWGEPALKTMFMRGLSEDVQAELVFRGPELTLNQAIEAAISLDTLLRGRRRLLRESLPPVFLGEPSPREAEPMQLGRTRLTPEEKQRRRREGLCLYCGQAGHLCSSCPTRPGQTRTAEVSVSFTDMLLNHMSIDVTCILAAETFSVSALVDSGAAGNFMDIALAEQLKIPLQPMNNQLRIKALDGRPLGTGTVTKQTPDIDLQVGLFHREKISFFLVDSPDHPIILGYTWLAKHDPVISWKHGEILKWSNYCQDHCLDLPCRATTIESPEEPDFSVIPDCYHDIMEVFSKERATQLPPHRPGDCSIDLLPNTTPPRGRVYPLSEPESQALETYIDEALAMGHIRPSKSPFAAGFFFVQKKDGGLRPCVDYRGLNAISVKNPYPLPLRLQPHTYKGGRRMENGICHHQRALRVPGHALWFIRISFRFPGVGHSFYG